MPYLLDSNTWIHYLKHPSTPIENRLRNTPVDQILVCSVVWAELLYGSRKYGNREERVARVELTLKPFRSLPFDDSAARHYADIRDKLEALGEVIGANDLIIAAIALANQLTLVTNDKAFRRVPGLSVEDWSVGDEA